MSGPADSTAAVRRRYVADLAAAGAVPDPLWRSVFEAVPRHEFVPTFYRAEVDPAGVLTGQRITSSDPGWVAAVYSDLALPVRRDVTSASTSPSLMARMLGSLDVTGDQRVLEIGTGTGYNAALLCERVGSARVTSVDIDPDLVDDARRRLLGAGYRPTVAVADGASGHPVGAPYDRIIATCRVDVVPRAWTDQLAPGGVVVAPVGTGVVVLARRADGGSTLTGRFENYYSYFMPMRTGAEREQLGAAARRAGTEDGSTGAATVPVSVYRSRDERFWLELTVPGVVRGTGANGVELVYHRDGSWARLHGDTVVQGGPRRLWSDVETWLGRWHQHGRPGPGRIGLTVGPEVQAIWLDRPEHVIRSERVTGPGGPASG